MNDQKVAFAIAAVLLPCCLAAAPMNITPGTASLQCAHTRLNATAHCFDVDNAASQCISQSLILENLTSGEKKPLPQGGKLVHVPFVKGQKVLDAVVTSWACITAKTGKQFIYLLHTCKAGDGNKVFCARGNEEFDSLFALDGTELTARARAMTTQRKKLNQRLGLALILAEGVQLDEVAYKE